MSTGRNVRTGTVAAAALIADGPAGNPIGIAAEAYRLCGQVHGKRVYVRGLLEFTNRCTRNCLYCGIRRGNGEVRRYSLSEQEILDTVNEGFRRGFRSFVLQGGEDPEWPVGRLARLVGAVKERTRGEAAVVLGCGEMSRDELRTLRSAGTDRYLIRFETSDPVLYRRLRPESTLDRRLGVIRDLKELGFQTGSGFMTGLPGEGEETRERNVRLCRDLRLDMVGIGPFIPHPRTPLRNAPQQPLDLAVDAVAKVRLLLPKAHLPATTAAGSLAPDGRERMLLAGANVLMPNITPVPCKKDYQLYPGKICLDESGFDCVGCLALRTASVGRELCFDRGDAIPEDAT